jgi:hypothetical protein
MYAVISINNNEVNLHPFPTLEQAHAFIKTHPKPIRTPILGNELDRFQSNQTLITLHII